MTPKQTISSRRLAKYLLIILFVALLIGVGATIIYAGEVTDTVACPAGKICNPTTYSTIDALLLAVVGVVVQYGLILIVFFLVLAGFKFVVAQGNPEKINDAKKMLVWVIVGAFVLIGVYVIRAAVCGTVDKIRGVENLPPSQKTCPPPQN